LAAASAALGDTAKTGWAHDLRPPDPAHNFDDYERIVNRDVTVRMLYEWPRIPRLAGLWFAIFDSPARTHP
jgi:hypothetical protein